MILVTGGAGFIGSHVVKALSESGEQVIVFDNLSQGQREALLHGEELVIGDIRDKVALQKLFAQYHISTVIHLAALVNAAESIDKAELYQQVNDQGSRNVWEMAHASGVTTFLYSSSAAVYGIPREASALAESAPLNPSNPYGATKLAGERSLFATVPATSQSLIFRFFNVGGAEAGGRLGQSRASRAIMQRLFAVAAGLEDQVLISGHDYPTPDGTVVRDFVHVEDVAQAFLLGLKYLRSGGRSTILNLGTGIPHTIGEVVKTVERLTGHSIPVEYGPRNPGDISYSLSDISLAVRTLNWQPAHDLDLIVRDGWTHYVNRKV